jgi:hypothetical protein
VPEYLNFAKKFPAPPFEYFQPNYLEINDKKLSKNRVIKKLGIDLAIYKNEKCQHFFPSSFFKLKLELGFNF